MSYFYEQKDQEIFMFPETSTYCTPLNGTLVVANPATYPWYSRINLIPDGIDYDMPIQLKEKIWEIGSGKHPSHIANTFEEPVDITLTTYMQDARFLALATGTSSTADAKAGSNEQDLDITCIGMGAAGALAEGDYFLLYTIADSGVQTCNALYIWNTTGSGPTITGCTNIKIDCSGGTGANGADSTATEVAAAIATALTAATNYTCTSSNTVASVTVHGPDASNCGAVCDVRDGPSGNETAFIFTVVTYGASTHTITASTGSSLPSFGLHIEQVNTTAGENICIDLYGCIVKSYEMSVDYSTKIITESIIISTVKFAVGTISTIPPPRRALAPHTWQNLSEDTSKNIIMLGSTDKTPAITNSILLTIENDIELFGDIGKSYAYNVIAGMRTIKLKLVGHAQLSDIWTYWKDTWDDVNGYYTNAAAKLNSYITVERTETYDTFYLTIDNWLIEEYALKLFPISERIMGIDVTFTGATPASVGAALIDGLVIVDYVPKIFYNETNS